MDTTIDPLSRSLADFRRPRGRRLLDRLDPAHRWIEARKHSGHWQYFRALTTAAQPQAALFDANGRRFRGVNFAVQDYLGLSSHPAIVAAAQEAAARYGVHSAGSGALLGNSALSLQLEETVAGFLDCQHALLYPTGWGAGFGVIQGLIRVGDYVVMDELAHACLQTGAAAATANVVRFAHNSSDDLRAHLARIRGMDADKAILVLAESLYSMDSDVPDLRRMQDVASEYEAILMVDVAHDLGNLGPGGSGFIGAQGMLGEIDIVMGNFSKTFASNGGFVAANHPSVVDYLRAFSNPWTFSNALSPIQCAVVLKALEIVQSVEGERLRRQLLHAVCGLREHLEKRGCQALGIPSAIVPVMVGETALFRIASGLLPDLGVFANPVEFPAVAPDRSRFRMQVMATHSEEDVAKGTAAIAECIERARLLLTRAEPELAQV